MKTVVVRQTIRTAWLFYSAIILLAFVAGCTLSTPSESDDTVDSTSEATTTTEVEISLSGIAAQSRSTTVWALNTDFAVNMQTMYVVITAPDFAERREEMSLETGKVMLTVTAGVDRTFKIEAHNQSGMIVYESAPRTLDVVAGTPLSIDIEIDPVELRLPLLSVTQANPGTRVDRGDYGPGQSIARPPGQRSGQCYGPGGNGRGCRSLQPKPYNVAGTASRRDC